MKPCMKDRRFPPEVTTRILEYLLTKDNFRNYRLVCSFWNSAITSMYLKDGSYIQLYENELHNLVSDIAEFSTLGEKINYINLLDFVKINDNQNVERGPNKFENFVKVVTACPNLTKITLSTEDLKREYLELLVKGEIQLPSIQEIHVKTKKTLQTNILHMKTNLVYCKNITVLNFYFENVDLDEFGGLYTFISNFPKLKMLTLFFRHEPKRIDLSDFMEACAPSLEILKLMCLRTSFLINKSLDFTEDNTQFKNLKHVSFYVNSISANTLEYVMSNFNNLNRLNIQSMKTMTDFTNSSYKTSELQDVFQKLSSYLNEIKIHSVKLHSGLFASVPDRFEQFSDPDHLEKFMKSLKFEVFHVPSRV